MTITLVPQLTVQPKDTFEKLRHRLAPSTEGRRNAKDGYELVYFRPTTSVDVHTIAGSTAFSLGLRAEPFMRKATNSAFPGARFDMWDYSATGSEITPATTRSGFFDETCFESDIPEIPHHEQVAMEADLLHQRAVNRHFAPLVRAREEEIVAQWVDTPGTLRADRPHTALAPLCIPVMDYLEAFDVMDSVHVLPTLLAGQMIGARSWHSGKMPWEMGERVRTTELRPGDVINTRWSSWSFESMEYVQGTHRSCHVVRGRRLSDGEPVMAATVDSDTGFSGFMVSRRAQAPQSDLVTR